MEIILDWFKSLLTGGSSALSWLTTSYSLGSWSFTPLTLLTFGGLSAYLTIAIIKWVVDIV